jgi:hypothetical protein
MAEYHPLIARAVAGLEHNTGENRRVLYERARAALVNQLRGVTPALDEADITRERLALEEAIRQVESEEAARARVPEPESEPDAPPEEGTIPLSLRDQALRDFRETMAEAEGLGDASADANRAARETYRAVPPRDAPPPVRERNEAAGAAEERHYFEPPGEAGHPPLDEDADHDGPGKPPMPPVYDDADETAYPPVRRSYGRLIAAVVILLVLAGIAGAGYWQRDTISSMVASWRNAGETGETASKPAPPPAGAPKIADRVGPSNSSGTPASKPANAPAAAVAQKVVLYDEDPSNPQGKRYVGSAIWRTETVSPGPGLAPELAVRADVEIPERHMRMTWSLRRNTDKALPASHTIEIMFTLPADFDQGGIANVPGVLMKQNEQARGVPLAGLAVKVTNGYFLIGLSAVEIDVQRNIKLLKDRDWFDIPIVYTSGKRAILAMEKGTPGVRAFEEAFRAWGE